MQSSKPKGQKRRRQVGKHDDKPAFGAHSALHNSEHVAELQSKKRFTFDDEGNPATSTATLQATNGAGASPSKNKSEESPRGKNASTDEDRQKGNSRKRRADDGKKVHMGTRQKKRKLERKKHDKSFDVMAEIKQVWESARLKEASKEKRREAVTKLIQMCKGKIKEIIFKHDGSRIIQCIAKYGDSVQRQTIIDELTGSMVELSKTMYSRFLVKKLLRHGTKEQRAKIIKEFYGKVKQLIRHKEASVVIEFIFSEIASNPQRAILISEFYGPSVAISLASAQSGRKPITLTSVLKEDPSQIPMALQHMKDTIAAVLEKGILNPSLVHRLLLDYLTYTDDEGRKELVGTMHDAVAHILHTKEGAQVGVYCCAYGSPKDRKAIVKCFKGVAGKIAMEEYGHVVLLSLLDVTDDTVLTTKSILGELLKQSEEDQLELVNHKWAKQVFLNALAPHSTKYFTPDVLRLLAPPTFTDKETGQAVSTSKKDPEVRRKQILEFVQPLLVNLFSNADALHQTVTSPNGSQVLYETIMHAKPEQRAVIYKHLAMLAGKPKYVEAEKMQEGEGEGEQEEEEEEEGEKKKDTKGKEKVAVSKKDNEEEEEPENVIVAADFVASRLLCRLIKADAELGKALEMAQEEHLYGWATQKGTSFVVASLLETQDQALTQKVTQTLKAKISELRKADVPGAKVIVRILTGEPAPPKPAHAQPKAK